MQLVGNCVFCPDDTRSSCTFSPWSLRQVAAQKNCTSLLAPCCRHPLSTQYIVKLRQRAIWCIYIEHQFGDGAPEPTTKKPPTSSPFKNRPDRGAPRRGGRFRPSKPRAEEKRRSCGEGQPRTPPTPARGGATPPAGKARATEAHAVSAFKSVLQAF